MSLKCDFTAEAGGQGRKVLKTKLILVSFEKKRVMGGKTTTACSNHFHFLPVGILYVELQLLIKPLKNNLSLLVSSSGVKIPTCNSTPLPPFVNNELSLCPLSATGALPPLSGSNVSYKQTPLRTLVCLYVFP